MKSSYSQETNCVEITAGPGGGVWLRETTGVAGGGVLIPAGSWQAFLDGVKDGEFDRLTEPVEAGPDDERAAYIRGLRNLAGLLAANPDLPLPQTGRSSPNAFYVVLARETSQREQLAAWLQHMAGTTSVVDGPECKVRGTVGGLHVTLLADRDEVCERVVVGIRQVVRQIPDPNPPMVEVVDIVEDFEWVCPPLAADQTVGTQQ